MGSEFTYSPEGRCNFGSFLIKPKQPKGSCFGRYIPKEPKQILLFRIVSKLISVPVSVIPKQNQFRRTPYSKQSYFFFGLNKLNLFGLFFGLFRGTKKHFSVCFGPVSKQPKQTEFCRNYRKNLQKSFSIRGSSIPLIFFLGSNRNSICFGCFSVCFFAKSPQIFSVCFDVSDRYRNNRNKLNLWCG